MNKITYEFDPWELMGIDPPLDSSKYDEAMSEMKDFIKTEALAMIAAGKSPVAGGEYKRTLSAKYKKIKESISGADFANLELTGEMLDAFDVVDTGNGTLEWGVWGSKQAAKADGHNNFSGKSELPPREFIPNADKGQKPKRDIISGMKGIAAAFLDEG